MAHDAEHEAGQGGGGVAAMEATSRAYLGQWQRLVSTTNWEKGKIICQWRQALIDSGADWQEYSDEAWSRHVGNVSSQHVGRLRRVSERFGPPRETYPGLYWSHFQAAIDWPDAEMWLEGAVQSGWSISQMRAQRMEAMGGLPGDEPPQSVLEADVDEDFTPEGDDRLEVREARGDAAGDYAGGPDFGEGPDFGDDVNSGPGHAGVPFATDIEPEMASPAAVAVRPFEQLAALPADVAEAFESFKLAILHHKLAGWAEISCHDLLGALESLKQLALAPSAG
ncbi:MAG TPA: hypothetical protein VHY20_02845 [Pirellulales bacterium]|nr:hypothetical protein [Pirellulales bacterium]